MQAAEGIVGGTEQLPSSTSVVEATKNITVDEDAAGTKIEGDASKYATSQITADVDTTGEATTIDQVFCVCKDSMMVYLSVMLSLALLSVTVLSLRPKFR